MGDTAYSVLELGLHANTRTCDLDYDWSVGCGSTSAASRTHPAHNRSSACSGQASSLSRTGLTGPSNRLAEPHAFPGMAKGSEL
jgi:hypothetical protein